MKPKIKSPDPHPVPPGKDAPTALPGYPTYPASEDIFKAGKEVKSVNPDDLSKVRESAEIGGTSQNNEKSFAEDPSGGDLDVPGSELDDEQEKVGSEDEENNFYSIGGDDHANLEEDQGS